MRPHVTIHVMMSVNGHLEGGYVRLRYTLGKGDSGEGS